MYDIVRTLYSSRQQQVRSRFLIFQMFLLQNLVKIFLASYWSEQQVYFLFTGGISNSTLVWTNPALLRISKTPAASQPIFIIGKFYSTCDKLMLQRKADKHEVSAFFSQ